VDERPHYPGRLTPKREKLLRDNWGLIPGPLLCHLLGNIHRSTLTNWAHALGLPDRIQGRPHNDGTPAHALEPARLPGPPKPTRENPAPSGLWRCWSCQQLSTEGPLHARCVGNEAETPQPRGLGSLVVVVRVVRRKRDGRNN
jgi:hypothetical protein